MDNKQINETLENLRVSYRMASLDFGQCDPNPEIQFDKWFEEALKARCDEPNAFVLSTVQENRPRSRVLLLKGIHEGKFIFYTNYLSAKGSEIEANPYASMNFLWLPLHRQIRIEGKIQKVDNHLSDDYFSKRPRGNQLGALASPQSKRIASRADLEKLFHDIEVKYASIQKIERPAHWGGYGLVPEYFEFWQGRDNRMHDRIIYEKKNGKWELSRLAP